MEEKIISGSDKSCTVTVTGETTKVRFEMSCMYIQVRHLSGEIICGRKSDIADGANGTAKLTSGGICFDVASPVIYIGGNGVCEVYATNSEALVFKGGSGGGDKHGNLDVLDKLGEDDDGNVTYNGEKIGGNSGMTLIGTFNVDSASWTNIGTIEAGTRLLLESANTSGQASTSPNVGTMVGYTVVPKSNKYQNLYLKVMMMYPATSVVASVLLRVNTNGMIALSAHGTATTAVYNVYKLEVPTA